MQYKYFDVWLRFDDLDIKRQAVMLNIDQGMRAMCHDWSIAFYFRMFAFSRQPRSVMIDTFLEKLVHNILLEKIAMQLVSAEAPKMRSRVVWFRWMFIGARTHNAHCEAGHNG